MLGENVAGQASRQERVWNGVNSSHCRGVPAESFDSLKAFWCKRVHIIMLVLNWYGRVCHTVGAFSTFSQNLYSHFVLINSKKKCELQTFAHPWAIVP